MIALDEQALVCDLAEVYHIFDYRSLPVQLVATLSSGLREDSRIMMKLGGEKVTRETILLAGICDRLTLIMSMFTDNKKPPQLITDMIFAEPKEKTQTFASYEEFLAEWERLTNGGT